MATGQTLDKPAIVQRTSAPVGVQVDERELLAGGRGVYEAHIAVVRVVD